MNAPVSRRVLLGATAATVGAAALPAIAETVIPVSVAAHSDEALFALLARYPAALAEADAAEAVSADLWDRFTDQEPPRPEALFVRFGDDFPHGPAEHDASGRWRQPYDEPAIARLRAAPDPTGWLWVGEEGDLSRMEIPDPRRCARRTEIIAAHDGWKSECDVVKARLGLPAADEAECAAVERLDALTAAILATPPQTTTGLGAKARWASREELSAPTRAAWSARILADVVALAESDEVAV